MVASKLHLEVVQLLLFNENSPDCNLSNNVGMTALHFAVVGGIIDIVNLLLIANANVNLSEYCVGNTPLMLASSKHTECVQTLLSFGYPEGCDIDCNLIDHEGKNALHLAAEEGNRDIITLLLRANMDVNQRDGDGNTPLILASKEMQNDTVKLLISCPQVDIRAKNSCMETCLHVACSSGNLDIVKPLLDANADVNEQALHGVTPLMMAIECT